MEDTLKSLPPGSKEAGMAGCRCPVMDNSYGKGYMMQEGIFVISGNCPIHAREEENGRIDKEVS